MRDEIKATKRKSSGRGKGRSGRKSDKADYDMYDWCRRLYWLASMREVDGGDAAIRCSPSTFAMTRSSTSSSRLLSPGLIVSSSTGINIKNDSRLEGLIKMADLVFRSFSPSSAAICTPADYNTRPLDTIYSNFIDALPVGEVLLRKWKAPYSFSTCSLWKTIGAYPKTAHCGRIHLLCASWKTPPCIFGPIEKQRVLLCKAID
ncbi:Bifunctional polymyxin resistance protein [Datura stramonium]|uniref:Bifunctional polymyxin resistance protein n=1 Tax=Datura stramonium TaxID=4076 RepID=A0ABS8V4M3_DATST|nr:Bifunctional polymyxin resistance protein [Datura stramonium]